MMDGSRPCGGSSRGFETVSKRKAFEMRNLYVFLYYFSLVYLVIAGINWLVAGSVMLMERKHYSQQLAEYRFSSSLSVFIALLTPIIYGLGWIFFVPSVLVSAFKKK